MPAPSQPAATAPESATIALYRAALGTVNVGRYLPVFERSATAGAKNVAKGAYILEEASNSKPEVILIATGSEVEIAVNARLQLEAAGIVLGKDYPSPIVDHDEARKATLIRYNVVKKVA